MYPTLLCLFTVIVVGTCSRAPEKPDIQIMDYKPKEGEVFTARCEITNDKPEAKIKWFLERKNTTHNSYSPLELLEGLEQPIFRGKKVIQTIRLTLTPEDNDAILTCKSEYTNKRYTAATKFKIKVLYAPKLVGPDHIVFSNAALGADHVHNVLVQANPKPNLLKLYSNFTNDIRTFLIDHTDGDYYYFSIRFDNITSKDFDYEYYFALNNSIGSVYFDILFSKNNKDGGIRAQNIVFILCGISLGLVLLAVGTVAWRYRRRANPPLPTPPPYQRSISKEPYYSIAREKLTRFGQLHVLYLLQSRLQDSPRESLQSEVNSEHVYHYIEPEKIITPRVPQ